MPKPNRIPYATHEEWLAIRNRGLGGSDIAAVLGFNRFKSPLQVYLEKRGEAAPEDLSDNERVYWGTRLESLVAEEYEKRTSRKVRRVNAVLQHPDHPWMLASLDRDVVADDRILEVKTTAGGDEWGEEGTDQVPVNYLMQTMHYLAVTGASVCDLAVLISGRDFRIYQIHRDNDLIEEMIRRGDEFWSAVMDGVPPAPRSLEDVNLLFPSSAEATAATADAFTLLECSNLADLQARAKELDSLIEASRVAIQTHIGSAESLVSPDGQILATWKSQKTARFDTKKFAKDHPDLDEQYRVTTESRRFLLKVKG